jgi:hypothetical protein
MRVLGRRERCDRVYVDRGYIRGAGPGRSKSEDARPVADS